MAKDSMMVGIKSLCDTLKENSKIDPKLYEKFDVSRGLRRSDGTGVVAGITNICNVHGYVINEGERENAEGELIYRGYNLLDILNKTEVNNVYGYEETVFLLIFGKVPSEQELKVFENWIIALRSVPNDFVIDMIYKAPSKNIMNKLARSILALYSYDERVEDKSIENEVRTAARLIAQLPVIMAAAYHVKQNHYEGETLYLHNISPNENTAQSILSLLRVDREYTPQEAKLLDQMLIMHAEHGGGNNSTFTCRTLTSSGTDPYSAYAAAIGSLKGPKHGGANIKVMEMLDDFKANVKDLANEGQIADHMKKILEGQANDGSGLIYGMGHAIYTLSDPRAVFTKKKLEELAKGTDVEQDFQVLKTVERLTPEVFKAVKGSNKTVCANVDMYSGLVYKMLGIPQ
ncbi:MAG: citrate synthase, partial [Oscillospiraceae bacterium]|nr:citrate synthase [Oscillospiraceae bacterium]